MATRKDVNFVGNAMDVALKALAETQRLQANFDKMMRDYIHLEKENGLRLRSINGLKENHKMLSDKVHRIENFEEYK